MVAFLDGSDTLAHLGHHARALVAGQHRQLHRGGAGQDVVIGVAHACGVQLDLDLAFGRITERDLFDDDRLVELANQRAFCLH
ncbi:Uncharacterised protein [Mycobacteroides abscessus subsp. abscessus]|nr:Uncharacterised protein [Mycobacteroides abscessus subsp. abscessus]